jgi:hypothetical protein
MNRRLIQLLLFLLAPLGVLAQQAKAPVYMQIFYEGANWMAGHGVLHYSPSFRGKTQELVNEPDSTRQLSPGAMMLGGFGQQTEQTVKASSVTTSEGTFVSDGKGKMRPQTKVDTQQEARNSRNQFNRSIRLLETRAALAHNALTKALNETAADGWEVVQVAASGSQGGLVYLLRRR